jgi:hypothetical protein
MPRLDPLLGWLALAHAVLALIAIVLLAVAAPPILGVHPALKPLKFGISVAAFLATMAVLLPILSVAPATRAILRWTFALTMIVEMSAIVIQALRGTRSHFNLATPLDASIVHLMLLGILVLTIAILATAVLATARPLAATSLEALGWRAGLWIYQLAVISGAAMGGRGQHTVGAPDGGPGLPLANWSRSHGDLRVSHFLAVHALQALPLLALTKRWPIVIAGIAIYAGVVVWTLARALAGRPLY